MDFGNETRMRQNVTEMATEPSHCALTHPPLVYTMKVIEQSVHNIFCIAHKCRIRALLRE